MSETIDMQRIAALVRKSGFAAYVEHMGGGTAAIRASREWEERPISRMGQPAGSARFPKENEQGLVEVTAGPGWFERQVHPGRPRGMVPTLGPPKADSNDFYVGRDSNEPTEVLVCSGLDEAAIASRIVAVLNGARLADLGRAVFLEASPHVPRERQIRPESHLDATGQGRDGAPADHALSPDHQLEAARHGEGELHPAPIRVLVDDPPAVDLLGYETVTVEINGRPIVGITLDSNQIIWWPDGENHEVLADFPEAWKSGPDPDRWRRESPEPPDADHGLGR